MVYLIIINFRKNGPLIDAMQSGGVFLIDEISLADDSVLERLNSVLETEQTLMVPERGGENPEETILAA
jgi:midasin